MKTVYGSGFITLSHTDDDHLRMQRLHHERDIYHGFLEYCCYPVQDTGEVDILTADIEIRIFLYPYFWRYLR